MITILNHMALVICFLVCLFGGFFYVLFHLDTKRSWAPWPELMKVMFEVGLLTFLIGLLFNK